LEDQQELTDEDFSYWKSMSLKIKMGYVSFLLAKFIFIPAALLVFVPIQTGYVPLLRAALLALYGSLIIATVALCCWEMFGEDKKDIPPEHKVLEWMEYYSKK